MPPSRPRKGIRMRVERCDAEKHLDRDGGLDVLAGYSAVFISESGVIRYRGPIAEVMLLLERAKLPLISEWGRPFKDEAT